MTKLNLPKDQHNQEEIHIQVCPGRSILIPIQSNSGETRAVIDTAAQATLVNRSFFLKSENKSALENKPIVLLKGLGEVAVEAVKISRYQFQIGDVMFFGDVFITSMADDFILGLDFLEHHQSQVNLENGTVQIGGQLINADMKAKPPRDFHVNRVNLSRKTVVPPNTMVLTEVKIDTASDEPVPYCVEAVGSNEDLLVARALVTGSLGTLRIINNSDHYISLKQGHQIGMASEVVEIKEVEDLPSCIPVPRVTVEDPEVVEVSREENQNGGLLNGCSVTSAPGSFNDCSGSLPLNGGSLSGCSVTSTPGSFNDCSESLPPKLCLTDLDITSLKIKLRFSRICCWNMKMSLQRMI